LNSEVQLQYQLVVQVKDVGSGDFERLVNWENALAEYLGPSATVDGHDLGAGEFNVFIFTDDPVGTFQSIRGFAEARPPPESMAAAYRLVNSDEYIVLWPPESLSFDIA
jgi:hypothetical protein